MQAYNLIKSEFNTDIIPYFPHHNIDSYRKSLFLECYKTFNKEFEQTLNNRFRDYTDVQRMIVSFYALAINEAVLEKINLTLFEKLLKKEKISSYISLNKKINKNILSDKTKLLCLNDCAKATDKDRKNVKALLEMKFPHKSSFEK